MLRIVATFFLCLTQHSQSFPDLFGNNYSKFDFSDSCSRHLENKETNCSWMFRSKPLLTFTLLTTPQTIVLLLPWYHLSGRQLCTKCSVRNGLMYQIIHALVILKHRLKMKYQKHLVNRLESLELSNTIILQWKFKIRFCCQKYGG